jgi:predicted lipoprotein with Yx(FWY)xxD motif
MERAERLSSRAFPPRREIPVLKSLAFAALAVLAAGTAFAAEPASPPPQAKNGMFVTAKGMTLYTFDKDSAGKSACNGPCAVNWPPALVSDDTKPMGPWTVVVRDDGLKQWAYKGKPVYAFAKDAKPGDTTGDGFLNGAWHIAKP